MVRHSSDEWDLDLRFFAAEEGRGSGAAQPDRATYPMYTCDCGARPDAEENQVEVNPPPDLQPGRPIGEAGYTSPLCGQNVEGE